MIGRPRPPRTDSSAATAWRRRWAEGGERIGFLLLPKFSALELFCAVDSLRIANRVGQCRFEWDFVSLDGRPVTASNGVGIDATRRLGDSIAARILFVVASFEPESLVGASHRAMLRRLARQGVLMGAMDTGPFVLARAGLLEGRRVTVHWEAMAAFAEEFPDIELTSKLFELHRDRLTCSGGSAVIDMMLHLIALQKGEALARAVGEQIIHPTMRPNQGAQRSAPNARYGFDDADVAAAITLMETHLEQPLPILDIAQRVGLSQRQLERRYRRHLGQTAKNFYVGLRLERARQLLIDSRVSVTAAAVGTGFDSVAHFSRSFCRTFGHPPRAARAQSLAPAAVRG